MFCIDLIILIVWLIENNKEWHTSKSVTQTWSEEELTTSARQSRRAVISSHWTYSSDFNPLQFVNGFQTLLEVLSNTLWLLFRCKYWLKEISPVGSLVKFPLSWPNRNSDFQAVLNLTRYRNIHTDIVWSHITMIYIRNININQSIESIDPLIKCRSIDNFQ